MIQIDMEMPDNCYCCILCRHADMFCRRLGKMLDRDDCYDERPQNCPLHEVTDPDTISRQATERGCGMTNREAIDVLKVLKAMWEEDNCEGEAEALRMAIEALEKKIPSRPYKSQPHDLSVETYYCKCGEKMNFIIDWTGKTLDFRR